MSSEYLNHYESFFPNQHLEKNVLAFLKQYIDPRQSLLLGLSGGPDSMCLMHLLLRLKHKFPLDLHIVHIDHGWRSCSAEEAKQLEMHVTALGLPFHTTRLDPQKYKGNLEDCSRQDRLKYFCHIAKMLNAQGILLGHHQDDQAETVLKRILEGASLPYLSGIREVTDISGLKLFRPLLGVSKSAVCAWLAKEDISYFSDATNEDTRFLRARLRTVILPELEAQFGKQITANLIYLAREANILREHLDLQVDGFLAKSQLSSLGKWIDLKENLPLAFIELKYLLKKFCESFGCFFSRQQIEIASHLLESCHANKKICNQIATLEIDRGRLFLYKGQLPHCNHSFFLQEGEHQIGHWIINCRRIDEASDGKQRRNHWMDVWRGYCSVVLPMERYQLIPASPRQYVSLKKGQISYYREAGRFWNDRKVPRFLIGHAPVIVKNEGIVEDFLTGQNENGNSPQECYHVTLTRNGSFIE